MISTATKESAIAVEGNELEYGREVSRQRGEQVGEIMNRMTTDELALAGLPVVEEASEAVYEAVSGGQPVLLVHGGKPAAVVLDYESRQEVEELARGSEGVEW